MPTVHDRVLAALRTVRDADGAIVHGEGRVLAYRPPSLTGAAVLIALDAAEPQSSRKRTLRGDARRHPIQLDLGAE